MNEHSKQTSSEASTPSSTTDAPAVEELDVEQFAKEHPDREKPRARRYRIRIDRETRVVDVPCMTGTEILALVGLTPQTAKLYELERGKPPRRVEPNEKVCFTQPGVERFQTIPLDPTEGSIDAA